VSGITTRNKQVFNCHLNDNRDGAQRTVAGKLFYVRSLVPGKERSPTVTNRDRSTSRMSVSVGDLSRRVESMYATRCSDDDAILKHTLAVLTYC